MAAWRIVKERYAATAFSGDGARLAGGRWTPPGTRAVYLSATASLAALEMLVHLERAVLLQAYRLISVKIPERQIATVPLADLPARWQSYPSPSSLQAIGRAWLDAGEFLALAVPSAVVPMELNYILNPEHPGFDSIVVGGPRRFSFDPRLVGSRPSPAGPLPAGPSP